MRMEMKAWRVMVERYAEMVGLSTYRLDYHLVILSVPRDRDDLWQVIYIDL